MNNKRFYRYYLISFLCLLSASFYPLYMGARVIIDMAVNGTVMKENYPKYIVPYTPICIAMLIGMLIFPLCIKLFRRFSQLYGSLFSVGTFFAAELLFERKVVVTAAETVARLDDWQM